MATDGFSIDLGFNPVLNVEKLNVILNHVKTAMGALGSDIKQIDATKLAADMKKFDTELVQAGKHTDNLKKGFKETETTLSKLKSSIGQGLSIAIGMSGLDLVKNGLTSVVKSGMDYQKSLADMSALTGVSGKALDNLGGKARGLGLAFGTTAVEQITSMKGVLSRFGPDVAKTPQALAEITRSINILGEASGMDAATSMDALTNSMLQFGVDVTNPAQLAKESARFINTLGASAKFGAAEIPQVTEAIVNAGVACTQANVSFETANAALQVLAAGGKLGAEAGIGLRNVLSKIGSVELMTPDAIKGLKAGGVNMQILTDKTVPLQTRLKELQKVQNDGSTISKLFGIENAASANILISGAKTIGDYTKQMTGTNTAYEQAKVNSATLAAQWERLKAKASDLAVGGFGVLKPVLSGAMGMFSAIAGNVNLLLVPMGLLTAAFLLYKAQVIQTAAVTAIHNIQQRISLGITAAKTIATNVATAATWLWNAAMNANPAGLVLMGLVALIAGLTILGKAMNKSTEDQLKDNNEKLKSIKTDEAQLTKKKEVLESHQKLAESFKKQGKSVMENREFMLKLSNAYPGVIDMSKSYEENLKNITTAAERSGKEISNLNSSLNSLKDREIHVKIVVSKLNVDKLEQDIKKENYASGNSGAMIQFTYKMTNNFPDELAKVGADQKKLQGVLNKWKDTVINSTTLTETEKTKATGDLEELFNKQSVVNKRINDKMQGEIYERYKYYADKGSEIDKIAAKANGGIDNNALQKAYADKSKIYSSDLNRYRQIVSSKIKATNELQKAVTGGGAGGDGGDGGDPKPKEGPSAYELALKTYEQNKKTAESSVENSRLETELSDLRIGKVKTQAQLEEENLQIAQQKTNELKKQLEIFKTDVLVEATTKDDKNAAQDIINKLQTDILSSEKNALQIKVKIKTDAKAAAEELKKLEDDLARKNIEIAVKMGLKPEIDLINFDKNALQSQLDSVNAKMKSNSFNFILGTSFDPALQADLLIKAADLQDKIYDKNIELSDANEQIRLNGIKDSAKLERETRISEAKKALRQQLFDAKGNMNLEMAARNEYYQKLGDAEKAFSATQRVNILGLQVPLNQMALSFGASMNSAFANLSFSTGDSTKTTELKEQKNKLQLEEDALYESLRKREISQREYYDKLTQIQAEQAKVSEQIAQQSAGILKQIASGMATALQQTGMQGLDASIVKYQDNSVKILAIDKEIEANKKNQFITAKERDDREIELTNQRTAAAKESNIMIGEAYTNMGLVAAGALAELAINGKTSLKSIALVALNALQSMVPIWSAQILAGSLATPQSIATAGGAGLLQFTLLSGLMMTGVQLAKAAVNKFFFKGGPTPKGNPYDVGGIVHKNEFVFDHIMTGKYGGEFEKRHKEGLSAAEYMVKYEPETLRQFAEKRGDNSQEYKVMISQTQELIYENKQLHKELTEIKDGVQNLKATFSHKTATHVTGSFDIEGDKFRANIEKAKQVTLARI